MGINKMLNLNVDLFLDCYNKQTYAKIPHEFFQIPKLLKRKNSCFKKQSQSWGLVFCLELFIKCSNSKLIFQSHFESFSVTFTTASKLLGLVCKIYYFFVILIETTKFFKTL